MPSTTPTTPAWRSVRSWGSASWPTPRRRATGADGLLHQVLGYDDRLALTYAAADVLVGRGGASTVAEVAATGMPAVLVPWAGAAEDHQTLNVAWLADAGAAVSLAETEIARLAAVLDRLRADDAARLELGRRAHELGALHRSDRLARFIEQIAGTTG